jgi:hypothetical protein
MKALLLTSVPPCTETPAGIVLREMIQSLPKGSVISAAVVQPSYADAKISSDLALPHLRLIPPKERGLVAEGSLKRIAPRLSRLREIYRSRFLHDLIQKVADFGRLHGVDRIWVHLEATWTTRMAYPLAQSLGLPLFTMVFDPPSWYMNANSMDPWTQAEIRNAFDLALRSSLCCGTGSFPMAEEYATRYNIRTQALIHSFDQRTSLPPLQGLRDSDIFRIGMAGQLYAQDAWHGLLHMLDECHWEINGRSVIIRYLGQRFAMECAGPRNLEFLGWHSQEGALRLLDECDLLYCPYPFQEEMEEVARFSFPSKIVLYLAAARPILFHGPDYSSPSIFFRDTNSALICNNQNWLNLLKTIKRLWEEPNSSAILGVNAAKALKDYFSLDIMKHNLYSFFNLV